MKNPKEYEKRCQAIHLYKEGSPNGLSDLKSMGLKVSKTKAVLQRGFGEKPLSIWLKRSSALGKNWSLTGHAVYLLRHWGRGYSLGA
jgi:hypothetical protein